jgi:hypothetical protein
MTMYAIRPYGRKPDMMGFTLVALERNGEERPMMVFPTERQAQASMACLQQSKMTRLKKMTNKDNS